MTTDSHTHTGFNDAGMSDLLSVSGGLWYYALIAVGGFCAGVGIGNAINDAIGYASSDYYIHC